MKLKTLEDIRVSTLKEIQNKRESQIKVVEENPFIEITDNKTWANAKKNRTALVTARTSLEKEKRIVINQIKDKVTIPVTELYDEFINITKPHEDKQQEEVKRFEAIKEQERIEKERIEEERKQKHIDNIKKIVSFISEQIQSLDYKTSLTYEVKPVLNGELVTLEHFEEFGTTLLSELESLKFTLSSRKETLKQQEELRIEREKLEAERKENERINNHKQAIQNFYSKWINAIYSSTYQSFKDLKRQFEEETPLSVQEFQPEYAIKRAELAKIFEEREILLNNQEQQRIELEKQRKEQEEIQKAEQDRIQSENRRIQEEKEAIQKEKDELLKSKRIQDLKNLGFDDDLVLNLKHCKIIFPIEDILCPEHEFQDLLNNTKYRIENPPKSDNTKNLDYEEKINLKVKIKVERASDGRFLGHTDSIPGITTAIGSSLGELKKNMREAIKNKFYEDEVEINGDSRDI